jgi:small subunit ribosomal protein S1
VSTKDKDASSNTFAAMFAESETKATRGKRIAIGERLEVTVSKVGKDAVFVALNNKQEGFIDRTSFGEGPLTITEGTRIVAKVVELGGKAGAPRLEPLAVRHEDAPSDSPTAEASDQLTLTVGMHLKGTVTGVERYGVFIQIAGTQGRKGRGLIPAAESGVPRGADLRKQFPKGKELEAKVINIDEQGKIRLSISALKMDEEVENFKSYAGADDNKNQPSKPTTSSPRGFGTLGDLLAKHKIST